MLCRVRDVVIRYRAALLVMLCVVLVGAAYALGRRSVSEQSAEEKPAVMTQEATQDAAALRAQLDVSQANAEALQRQLSEVQADRCAPAATFYVQAPSVERAAQVVERQVAEDAPSLPRVARERSDHTIVTPVTQGGRHAAAAN